MSWLRIYPFSRLGIGDSLNEDALSEDHSVETINLTPLPLSFILLDLPDIGELLGVEDGTSEKP